MGITLQQIKNDIVKNTSSTYVEFASQQDSPTIEMHNNSSGNSIITDVQNWLPLASEEYEISKDIRDYVVVPVIIFPTDIPNRNSVAFPYEELLKFNVNQGRPNYKTWIGKPTFEEHEHDDYKQAKGIVFDTYMKPMKNVKGGIHKVVALCGFDRSKDPELANSILQGKRKSYSMGAMIGQYECSICGAKSKPGKLNTECGHVKRGNPQLYPYKDGKPIPSYLIARNSITGFEVSSVGHPAWSSATNSNLFDMTRY